MYFATTTECSRSSVKQWVKPAYPFMTCRGTQDKKLRIDLSLAFKDDKGKEIVLKGFDVKNGKYLNWEDKVNSYENKWRLKIFGSGTVWLSTIDGSMAGTYSDETISCDKGIFEVTKWQYTSGDTELNNWEKDVASVRLEIEEGDKCINRDGKKECPIKIKDGIDLKLSDKFRPIAVFCNSSPDAQKNS